MERQGPQHRCPRMKICVQQKFHSTCNACSQGPPSQNHNLLFGLSTCVFFSFLCFPTCDTPPTHQASTQINESSWIRHTGIETSRFKHYSICRWWGAVWKSAVDAMLAKSLGGQGMWGNRDWRTHQKKTCLVKPGDCEHKPGQESHTTTRKVQDYERQFQDQFVIIFVSL